jgi:multicomponent Na+:H+ antiporter subunit F
MGLVRALRGPTLQDRMLSVLLLGTGGVAPLLLMAAVLMLG